MSSPNKMSLVGTWNNELGSKMDIDSDDNGIIIGKYWSNVGENNMIGPFRLHGLWTTNEKSEVGSIGFIVVWDSYNSVTTWSGQLQDGNILTTWLLTKITDKHENWESTEIGFDVFTKSNISNKLIMSKKISHPISRMKK